LIQASGFTCEIIFNSPLLSALTSSEINHQLHRRIMDVLIVKGFPILPNIIAAMTCKAEQKLSRLKNEQIYNFLRNKVYN
jgi:uncharacterized protein YneF (UPF0154 family)